MGQLIAGPFCAQLLADFGADVLKVEAPGRPDPARSWGAVQVNGVGALWPVIGRGKRAMTLNLREADGQGIARELLADADVLVENFRPGTLERWGLGPEALLAANPRLVMVRVSGYGQTGPERGKAGFASVAEAKAGLRHLMGEPDRLPSRAGISLGDTLTGTFACLGAMMALHSRAATGRGQVVDAALYESCMALLEGIIPEYALGGKVRGRTGPVLPGVAPSAPYPCKDGVVVIGANQDALFARLCEAMETDWATDPRFAAHEARAENQALLDGMIAEWTAERPSADVLALCERHGVPAGPVNTAAELVEDAHIRARGMIQSLRDPSMARDVPMQAPVPRLSSTPGRLERPAPRFGEHTNEVLAALGHDGERRADLRKRGIV